jgi:hypothetical protein
MTTLAVSTIVPKVGILKVCGVVNVQREAAEIVVAEIWKQIKHLFYGESW